MTRTHGEIEELLGAYALNALDGDEVDEVERHLLTCPRCRAEVAEHREVAALLASGGPAPDGLWDRIASTLEEPPPDLNLALPGGRGRVVSLESRRGRGVSLRGAGLLAAAAVVVIALLAAGVVRLSGRVDDMEEQLASAQTVEAGALAALANPDATTVDLRADDGSTTARAAILPDGVGYLVASDVPELARDRTYQLWGIDGDVVYSLGVLGSSFEIAPFVASGDLDALAVTDEVSGGAPQPTSDPEFQGEVA